MRSIGYSAARAGRSPPRAGQRLYRHVAGAWLAVAALLLPPIAPTLHHLVPHTHSLAVLGDRLPDRHHEHASGQAHEHALEHAHEHAVGQQESAAAQLDETQRNRQDDPQRPGAPSDVCPVWQAVGHIGPSSLPALPSALPDYGAVAPPSVAVFSSAARPCFYSAAQPRAPPALT